MMCQPKECFLYCRLYDEIVMRQRRSHQDDNFAKLRHEYLSVRKLIAKILGAVSRLKIKRIKEMPAVLRAFCKYAMIFSPRLSSQTLLSNS